MEEKDKQYSEFLEGLVIEQLIREFHFKCEMSYIGKKRFGGSKITTYYFKDDLGVIWERDVGDRVWFEVAMRNPKMRARRGE